MSYRMLSIVVSLAACGHAASSHAQAWIGQIVGDIAAQEAARQREAACVAGTPAPEEAITRATEQSAALLEAYFALTSKSKRKDIGRVFDLRRDDVSYKSLDGPVSVEELGAILDMPTPTLEPKSFVVGGDGMTSRGIWAIAEPGEEPSGYYAVDFSVRAVSWRIWHITVLPADAPPAPAAAYCHYDPDQAW
jgi:hypothetical protein